MLKHVDPNAVTCMLDISKIGFNTLLRHRSMGAALRAAQTNLKNTEISCSAR